MDEKRRGDFAVTQYTEIDEEGGIKVQLPEWLGEDLPVLGRLYHRVVDVLVVDKPEWYLVSDLEKALTFLSTQFVSKYVSKLIKKAQNDVKVEAEAASKSKATARAARQAKAEAAAESKASTEMGSKRKAKKTPKRTKTRASRRKEVGRG